jgi:hypothetical protein
MRELAVEEMWGEVPNLMTINPMQSAHDAPRCKAKSKRTGNPCCVPAVRGCHVCRMHGARGGARPRKVNGNFRHGRLTKEVTETSRFITAIARLVRSQRLSAVVEI